MIRDFNYQSNIFFVLTAISNQYISLLNGKNQEYDKIHENSFGLENTYRGNRDHHWVYLKF